jgi:PAS domain S-box-containing protein
LIDNEENSLGEMYLNYQIDNGASLTSVVVKEIETSLGYSVEDFMDGSVTFMDRLHIEDADIANIIFSPQATSENQIVNLRLRHQDGRIRCFKATYSKSLYEDGNSTDLSLLLQDVKSLPRTMNYISGIMELCAVMENTDDFIFFKDRNHVLTGASQTLSEVCNSSEHWSDLLGRTDYDFFPEELADNYYRLEKKIFSGVPVTQEIQPFTTIHGDQGWADNRKYPIKDASGMVIGLYGIARDITEKKNAEKLLEGAKREAEAANKAKTEFLSSMSHDLRTPLNAIMGFSEMMSLKTFGPLGDPRYEDYVKVIHDSGSHLVSLIDDILDLSKVEAGKYVLNEEDLDIKLLIHKCVTMISTLADLKRLELITDIPPGLPQFRGDERTMIQVINNLLSNAVKFTPQDGHITVSAKVTNEKSIEIIVADTGIGMSCDDMTKAFKPFEQTDSAHAKRHEGTGLGLYLSQNLIKLHGGQLKVESDEGQGTTFIVHLPPQRCQRRSKNTPEAGVKVHHLP